MLALVMSLAIAGNPATKAKAAWAWAGARKEARDPYDVAYEKASREGRRLIVGVGMEPPEEDGVRVRLPANHPKFPATYQAVIIGEPIPGGGFLRRDVAPTRPPDLFRGGVVMQSAAMCSTSG